MEGIKFTYLLCIIATCITFTFEKNENDFSKSMDRKVLQIGGYTVPLIQKVPIPQEPFFQKGFLRSSLIESYGNDSYLSYNQESSSGTCMMDILQLFKSINDKRQSYKDYALKILDANAKLPSGVMEGYIFWFGSYDECVSAESPMLSSGRKISGEYCLATFNKFVQEPFSLTLGLCVPNSCKAGDIKTLINKVLNGTSIRALTTSCGTNNPFSTEAKVAFAVSGFISLLCLSGTVIDLILVYLKKQNISENIHTRRRANINSDDLNEKTGLLSNKNFDNYTPKWVKYLQYLTAFSFIKNTRSLFSTSNSSVSLTSVYGVRVLSMWWVVLGHTFLQTAYSAVIDNILSARHIVKEFWFQPIVNAWLSVDSFFLMSGLLVTFISLKIMEEREGIMNWKMFYCHRILRLTPAYGFVIMIMGTLYYVIPPGPQLTFILGHPDFPLLDTVTECTRTWWANLLYISNFYPYLGDMDRQCMKWSWYLANDMQFFVISPIIILLLYRHRKAGISLCGFLIVACISIRMITVYKYGILEPHRLPTKNLDDPYAKGEPLYNKPYTRIAPYMVGMLLGCALHVSNCRHSLSKVKLMIGWSVAIATGVATVFGLYGTYRSGKTMSLGWSIVYLGMERFTWSVALAWVIYACSIGSGGFVTSILSWKGWIPLARLNYCLYLVHPIVIEAYLLSLSVRFHFTALNMMYIFFGNLVTSYLVAYVLCMAVEAPMLGLEKLIFRR